LARDSCITYRKRKFTLSSFAPLTGWIYICFKSSFLLQAFSIHKCFAVVPNSHDILETRVYNICQCTVAVNAWKRIILTFACRCFVTKHKDVHLGQIQTSLFFILACFRIGFIVSLYSFIIGGLMLFPRVIFIETFQRKQNEKEIWIFWDITFKKTSRMLKVNFKNAEGKTGKSLGQSVCHSYKLVSALI